METSEQYPMDLACFFQDRPEEAALYAACTRPWTRRFQKPRSGTKTQISFYQRHLFAAVSLPIRRRKDWPAHCIVLTLGLPAPLDSPRIAMAVEPYPGRWTHHILIDAPDQIDAQLLAWLQEAAPLPWPSAPGAPELRFISPPCHPFNYVVYFYHRVRNIPHQEVVYEAKG